MTAGTFRVQNVEFEPGGAGSPKKPCRASAAGRAALAAASSLLGVAEGVLEAALTHRTITTGGGFEKIRSPLDSPEECADTAKALAKATFARMFDAMVSRLNSAIAPPAELAGKGGLTLGVLDIYGFEIFELNSFEQLCINYCNEKLQQLFIELTLRAEQEEYASEGVEWTHVEFFDNRGVCELIEGRKPAGLLALLDEESIVPQGCDTSFHAKIGKNLSTHPQFVVSAGTAETARKGEQAYSAAHIFTIKHYAGDVSYSSLGLLEKNKDALFIDLLECGGASSSAYTRGLFPEASQKGGTRKRPTSAATQFRASMVDLVAALGKCAPHYIRTIKPNDEKAAGVFDRARIAHQVRYLGLLENVRVRRAGFAFRQSYVHFALRFKLLSPRLWPTSKMVSEDPRAASLIVLEEAAIGADAYKLGHTKLFVRKPMTLFALEELRARKLHDVSRMIQAGYRSYRARVHYLELREKAQGIFQGKKRRRGSWALYFLGDYVRGAGGAGGADGRGGQNFLRVRALRARLCALRARPPYLRAGRPMGGWLAHRSTSIPARGCGCALSESGDSIPLHCHGT